MVAYQCGVCKRTVFSGRRKHVYERGHKERLSGVLKAFSTKVISARKMIKTASVVKYDPKEHENRFWCLCCEKEVKRHTSDGTLTVLHGDMLEHMNSQAHQKAVNNFWWTHQADRNQKELFLLTAEEYERFKSAVIKALENYEETEDTFIKEAAAQIREVEQSRLEIMQSFLEPVTQPTVQEDFWSSVHVPHSSTLHIDVEEAGPSGVHMPPVGTGPPLTFIGHQDIPKNGNVHTGALPPWMITDEEEAAPIQPEIGPSHDEFLKQKEKMKLKKLPPNRVGANFDHNSVTDEGWLPSFGRVWNSGRRWQSRHQYRKEAGSKAAKKKT
ncbi:hypothetical protein GDO86_012827 [Hymenochirus boettgeri]|uniref:Coiled-coil domain containing 84 n=1 Tax=Hymenochirus boettgeri TaxID=247094 RepID=A0A8T2ISN3_9PIPI|nr:hypothetical protein GDO86_012827 [Hymenochirus boettgeri]